MTVAAPAPVGALRIMVVDDSFVIRSLLARMVADQPDMVVVATAANGKQAIDEMDKHELDAIVLDIEMPVMDGITAIPLLLQKDPAVQIIIASTLSQQNAEISFRALRAGATDYLAKPSTSGELTNAEQFKNDLILKLRELGAVTRRKRANGIKATQQAPDAAPSTIATPPKKIFTLQRDKKYLRPNIIAIGSSTGGPQALFNVLSGLKGKVKQPIVITQHMPATFTAILAQHITQQTGLSAVEGADGMQLEGGRVYVAPGDYHMGFRMDGPRIVIKLEQTEPVNFCRPAVDVMIRSLMTVYYDKILAVILTGLGADGKNACVELFERGGAILAQDETTSVVWGMPGAVAQANICADVLPISHIAAAVERMAK
jgi:two-component system chemotaxis response regulator CheB